MERKSKKDLIQEVKDKGTLTKKEATDAVNLVIEAIKDLTNSEKRVLVINNFGRFKRTRRKAATRKVPLTGKVVKTPSSSNLSFKPSKAIKKVYKK